MLVSHLYLLHDYHAKYLFVKEIVITWKLILEMDFILWVPIKLDWAVYVASHEVIKWVRLVPLSGQKEPTNVTKPFGL